MNTRIAARAMAITALAMGATAAPAQYGPPESIGQGGAPVATPHYSPYDRRSPTYIGPPMTSSYGNRVYINRQGSKNRKKR